MKSLDQRVFEEVIEPMFPGEYHFKYEYIWRNDDPDGEGQSPACWLEGSFWLADKVGLFNLNRSLHKEDDIWVIGKYFPSLNQQCEISQGETIQETICNAVLKLYGTKNEISS